VIEAEAPCPDCLKPADLCVCAGIEAFPNTHELLILQHPQEQDRDLGTARLTLRHLAKGKRAVGLSWPNLAKALGRPADPKRWAVLYLGSAVLPADVEQRVIWLDRKGAQIRDTQAIRAGLQGIVLLDGTWAQAKALWWRNAWLLKLHRIVLRPPSPSRYGKLRKEPRRESVSTIEAAAQILGEIEKAPRLETQMNASFDALLARYRARSPGQG
jgi:DTW domain-containing protein YfiP